jgi:hypothetical protein
MAINTGKFSQAYLKPEGADRVERERRERMERDTERLRQQAPELGESLLQVFETLPGALAQAAAAELKRLRERYGREHPRVRRALREQEHLQGIAVQFDAGSARARRLLDFTHLEGAFFHGVVADTESRPLARVELRIETARGQEPLQGRSDEAGYFRIALPHRQSDDTGNEPPRARVRILDADGKTAHTDPLPLLMDGATHYREYRIDPPRGCENPRPTKPGTGSGGTRPRPSLETSTPLEHVRGIGPKRAASLRKAGIRDLESLLAADADRLVEILGFDIGPTREEAEKVLAEHRREAEKRSEAASDKSTAAAQAKKSATAKKATTKRTAAKKKPRSKD